MASYEEFQAKVDDLTFKVEDLLRWAQGLTDVAQSGELGALAFVQSLDAAPVGNQATARGNLGLGAAATRGVTGGSGNLMAQGAFGIGGIPDAYPLSSLNSDPTGLPGGAWYRTGAANSNRPKNLFGYVNVVKYDANRVTLIYYARDADNTILTRTYNGGWVTPWREYFHPANIVGAVSQAGGLPTGAIIERGSNANGQYVKFADGTMICSNDDVARVAVNEASGNWWRSDGFLWQFPAEFSGRPFVYGGISGVAGFDTNRLVGTYGQQSASTATLRVFSGTGSSPSESRVGCVAIGRWY